MLSTPSIPGLALGPTSLVPTVEPDPAARAAYDDAYGAYRRLFNSLRPMFEHAAPGTVPEPAP